MSSTPISLYIHFPWCVQKCPYCDFNSHAATHIPEEAYLARLLQDFEEAADIFVGRTLHSIFMGGGTPSLFLPKTIGTLLQTIQQRVPFQKNMEITLEANPGTVDETHFQGFRAAGINRLSLGIQSFNPNHLKKLGRIHDDTIAKRAIEKAKRAGFQNFNLDLMHGLPQQTLEEAMQDLQTALAFAPPHLSWYQLTIEPNTLFYRHPPRLPEDDLLADIQSAGETLLEENGLAHYEVSAFAKPNHASIHNMNYWQFGDYLGIGAGAHSKLKFTRTWRVRQPKDYLETTKAFIAGKKIITPQELPFEFMMNAMRLHQTISRDLFETRTGLPWETLTPALTKAAAKHLLHYDAEKIDILPQGRMFLNDLLLLFITESTYSAENVH